MDKSKFICLVIFTLICVISIAFIHSFIKYSPSDIPTGEYISSHADSGKITESIDAYRNIIGLANHYAIPTGIFTFIFVILCGLFLFNILAEDPDYTLLILAVASASFAVNSISSSQGFLFLPLHLDRIFSSRYIIPAVMALIVVYIILNRKKYFIVYFTYINLTAAAVLLIRYLLMVASNVYVPEWTKAFIREFPQSLFFGNFAYYITMYFLLACFLASYVYHIGKYAQAVAKTHVLRIQNRLITKNYESMVQNINQASSMRHEWKNNIIAMGLMYKQGKTAELGKYIEKLNEQLSDLSTMRYSENFTINAIVQNAAKKAQDNNISFRANIYVPKDLNISDIDMCSLIINMLDNSIEACRHMADGKKRFIEFNAKLNKGFLNISCKNSYCGSVMVSDSDSNVFETTKNDKTNHGFGIRQMNLIAKKYGSLLDISYGTGIFKVQTSLRNNLPE